MLYKDVLKFATDIKKYIGGLYISGSLKRKSEEINDIDFITMKDLNDIIDKLKSKYKIIIKKNGDYHSSVIIDNIQIDFWRARDKEELKYLQIMRAIDRTHRIAYSSLARKNGMLLNDYGLFKNGQRIDFKNEKELRSLIGVKGGKIDKEKLLKRVESAIYKGNYNKDDKNKKKIVKLYDKIISGGAIPKDKELYEKVKKEVYKDQKKHSLYRSGRVIREYKKLGGEFIDEMNEKNKLNLPLWFNQKWVDAESFLNDKIVKCGAETPYSNYPLCRPVKLLEKLGKDKIKIMLKEKQKLKNKPLITSKLFNTDEYNIKPTLKGYGKKKSDRHKKLLKISDRLFLKVARLVAHARGYDGNKLTLSDDGIHKLIYNHDDKLIKFGRKGYNDFINYVYNAVKGRITLDEAYNKMRNYRKRATNIKGEWRKNKYSPNNLAINILW